MTEFTATPAAESMGPSYLEAAIGSYFGDIAQNNVASAFGSGNGSIDQSEARLASFYGQTVSGEFSVLWTSAVTGEPPNNYGLGWYIPSHSH